MNITGKQLIKIICDRLIDEDILCHDGDIVNKLRTMTNTELNQAILLGDVVLWHNERIEKQ